MALIEIETPDGRLIRQHHDSLEAARSNLTAGYAVVGRVFFPDADDKGGFLETPGGPTLMSLLLQEHGAELLAWLNSRGVVKVQDKADHLKQLQNEQVHLLAEFEEAKKNHEILADRRAKLLLRIDAISTVLREECGQ